VPNGRVASPSTAVGAVRKPVGWLVPLPETNAVPSAAAEARAISAASHCSTSTSASSSIAWLAEGLA
jgi:hypothetical protein